MKIASASEDIVEDETEEEKEEQIKPGDIIPFKDSGIPDNSIFKEIIITSACQMGFNAPYVEFSLKSISDVTIEARINETEEFKPLVTLMNTLGRNTNLIICQGCRYYGYAILKPDKIYNLRFKAVFKGDANYSNEYIVDTSKYSEFMQKKCSG